MYHHSELTLLRRVAAYAPMPDEPSKCRFVLQVDPHGVPTALPRSSREACSGANEALAILALEQWRFEPARFEGMEIAVCTLVRAPFEQVCPLL